jgi:dTDP-4-dehydrorhamnose 3,5-epimerase
MGAFPADKIRSLAIADVVLVDLEIHVDARGHLYEVVHASDGFVPTIAQVYHVVDPRPDTIRAFHAHERLHDWFHIVHGSAIFGLVDNREQSPTYQKALRLVLTSRKPQLLVVPPGVYHGWMSLEPNTIMSSVASHEYDRDQPDEHRVPADHFDALFGGSPWRVEAR